MSKSKKVKVKNKNKNKIMRELGEFHGAITQDPNPFWDSFLCMFGSTFPSHVCVFFFFFFSRVLAKRGYCLCTV